MTKNDVNHDFIEGAILNPKDIENTIEANAKDHSNQLTKDEEILSIKKTIENLVLEVRQLFSMF